MTELAPCCVLRIPFDFQDGSGYIQKLFVVIGHHKEVAIAIKTTSKLERYGEKPHLTKGVVFMPAGPEPFTEATIVDPSSAFGIPHKDIRLEMEQGRVKVWATQDGFPCKMCAAIDENATLNKERKLNLKAILGC